MKSPSDATSERPSTPTEQRSPHLLLQRLVTEERVEPATAMLWMIHAYRYTQLVHAMADLGIADQLAAGPLSTDEISRRLDVPAERLLRLLRGLAWCGAVVQASDDTDEGWALTALGKTLVSGVEGSLSDDALHAGTLLYPAWGALTSGLRTGRVPYEVARGQGFFEELENEPTRSDRFDRVMNRVTARTVEAVVATLDLTGARCIVDVGGGNGETLARLLAHAPEARGVVFDLPRSEAVARANLDRHGCGNRCVFAAGDFFESVAPDGDLYILQRILHDWDDADCVRILQCVARALAPGARVLILEELLGTEEPGPNDHATIIDLAMMAVTGGRERTAEAYGALAHEAGLRLIDTRPTSSDAWILELRA